MGKLGIIFNALSYIFTPKEVNPNEDEIIAAEGRGFNDGFEYGYTDGLNDVLHADQHIPEPTAVTALDHALSNNPAIEAMDESLAD